MSDEIPGGRLIDRPAGLFLVSDPRSLYVELCTAGQYRTGTAEPNPVSAQVQLHGVPFNCSAWHMDLGGSALVVFVPFSQEELGPSMACWYLREGRRAHDPWQWGTKLLVMPDVSYREPQSMRRGSATMHLPASTPHIAAQNEVALRQYSARAVHYVAAVLRNGWYEHVTL